MLKYAVVVSILVIFFMSMIDVDKTEVVNNDYILLLIVLNLLIVQYIKLGSCFIEIVKNVWFSTSVFTCHKNQHYNVKSWMPAKTSLQQRAIYS